MATSLQDGPGVLTLILLIFGRARLAPSEGRSPVSSYHQRSISRWPKKLYSDSRLHFRYSPWSWRMRPVQGQAAKIGYINSAEVLANAPGALEAQEQFDEEMQSAQDELQQMENELQNTADELQRQALTLSPEARANREQQLQLMNQDYQSRAQQLSAEANQRKAELVQPIMDRVTAVIESIREEEGYALILDSTVGSIIAADPSLDLTQQVIDRLEAQAAEEEGEEGAGQGTAQSGSDASGAPRPGGGEAELAGQVTAEPGSGAPLG